MISLSSLMWATAVFFGLTSAIRGWRREVIGSIGVLLGAFGLLQFDSLLRGSLYWLLTEELTFLLQMAIFLAIVVAAYRHEMAQQPEARTGGIRESLLGAAAGFFNGYVIAGTSWYFLDINRYPFSQLILAPADGSASFAGLGAMPMLLLGGGLAGGGDLLGLVVLVILAVVLLIV